MTQLLRNLEQVRWQQLQDAYGAADAVPNYVRNLLSQDAEVRRDALWQLWGSVWHQGTVYECSPVVAPFLVEVLLATETEERTRAEVGLLLASMAAADSFVLPDEAGQPWRRAWQRDPYDETPSRDLAEETNEAAAASADELVQAFPAASPEMQASLVAVFAAIANALPDDAADLLANATSVGSVPLAAAAHLTRVLMLGREPSEDELNAAASRHEDLVELRESVRDSPPRVQAVVLARELSEAALIELRSSVG